MAKKKTKKATDKDPVVDLVNKLVNACEEEQRSMIVLVSLKDQEVIGNSLGSKKDQIAMVRYLNRKIEDQLIAGIKG